jgi:hypothetical protein
VDKFLVRKTEGKTAYHIPRCRWKVTERDLKRKQGLEKCFGLDWLEIGSNGTRLCTRERTSLHIHNTYIHKNIQDDQKVSVYLMITIQKVTSNVQSVTRQSPDIY